MTVSICFNCHYPLTPGDDICDNCGAVNSQIPANSGNNVSPASLTNCPLCHYPLTLGNDICENCGVIIPQGTSSSAGPAQQTPVMPAPAQATFPNQEICPNCGTPRQLGKNFCGRCGYNYLQKQPPASAQPKSSIMQGTMLAGKYRLEKIIGSGGMGSVHLAEDITLKRKVVIKALLNSDDPELVELSVKEREFLAEINHPNIVAIYDFLTEGNDGYIVMEYVQGKTLDEMLDERGRPFDVKTGIQYILDILPAFAYLANLKLVYCDFKPQNMMIHQLRDGSTNVKLIDLGTVIRYGPKPDSVYGTRGFHAREAIQNPSPQTDLYTICRTLAYCVTMMDITNPFFGMPPADEYQTLRENPALYRLLVKGTHVDPARRFQSVRELDEQLRGVLRLSTGGEPGMTMRSHKFVISAITKTSVVGRRGETALDEHDYAINTLISGDQALQIGNYVGALALYWQAAQANRQSIDAYARLVDTYIEENDLDQARESLRKARLIDPNHWKVYWCQGRIHEANGDLQKAIDQYNDLAMELPGELPPLESLARVYARQDNDDEAIRLYQSVLYADPDNVDSIFGIVQCEIKLQRWDEAIQHLRHVSETSSRYPDAQLLLCSIHLNCASPALPNSQSIQAAAEAVNHLKGRIEDARYYLVHAEIYYIAWKMAREGSLSKTTPMIGVKETTSRSLGRIAQESYNQYLRRDQPLAPREDIIRRKFEVTPWKFV